MTEENAKILILHNLDKIINELNKDKSIEIIPTQDKLIFKSVDRKKI